ncbi:MAG: phosphodiester glycosidase family protein [Ginsengibacter sp.]
MLNIKNIGKKVIFCTILNFIFFSVNAQIKWINLDSLYQPLPSSFHIYKSSDSLDEKPNVMYYAVADIKDENLKFTTDTTYKRRLTPTQFYKKNKEPLLVVNCSFFSFATNQNLNIVVKDGKIVSYNEETVPAKGYDTLTYFHSFFGALGISKKRKADVVWIYTDSSKRYPYASEFALPSIHDSIANPTLEYILQNTSIVAGEGGNSSNSFSKWKMQTVIGGGPVLLQNGEINISNNYERKFAGKAMYNHEPRTAIGYTKDNKLIILVCEGRSKKASGLTLIQLAQIFKGLGCVEALNLDGGGSSCMLINGKETNDPSSGGLQRPVPSVFLIEKKAR